MLLCAVLPFIFLFYCTPVSGAIVNSMYQKPTLDNHHKLLLISMDGLSYEYYERLEIFESFQYLKNYGTKAEFVRPPFPSMTSPSHTTLTSGLYVESHNVVHNCYYDWQNSSVAEGTFYSTLAINEWWDNGYENIWITAADQGLKSGGYLYPGSNATIDGKSATRSILETLQTPKQEEDWYDRIDDVMSWFTDDDFDFIALYFEEPDSSGHANGPYNPELDDVTFPLLDRTIKYIFQKVQDFGLTNKLNVILASDHGMLPIKRRETLQINDYLEDMSLLSFQLSYGPLGLYEPVEGKKAEVYEQLKAGTDKMKVYYREELPERFHYKNSDRLPSIVAVAKPGYVIYRFLPAHVNAGDHGFDNELVEMQTMFYGIGPSFKENYVHEGFDSIHVYSLMCYLLGLEPAPNNGSLDVTMGMLKDEKPLTTLRTTTDAGSRLYTPPILLCITVLYITTIFKL